MKRTHLAKHDLDWLPPSYRAIRWVVAGGLWGGLFGGIIVLSVISHVHFFVLGKGIAGLVAVEDARLLADGKQQLLPSEDARVRDLETMPLPAELQRVLEQRAKRRAKGKKLHKVRVGEFVLRDGDAVEILGYKSRTVDPT